MDLYFATRKLNVLGVIFTISIGVSLSITQAACRAPNPPEHFQYSALTCRKHVASLTRFGGVGDGKTSNTAAFRRAIFQLGKVAKYGGSLLYVPAGRWLTGSFNLTSYFTLYLHKDAVILGSKDEKEWPLVSVLPSYGKGRDGGGRYGSLISGSNLTDVAITGANGTIDGQGEWWWNKFHQKALKDTRPYLIELLHSEHILITNITLQNSPSWNLHPIYSRTILILGLTIIAPTNSPNTDGIDPDSCIDVKIEDCYVVSGDDCIAIKSGWDEFGISYGRPTANVIIRRLLCISPDSAVIALGSEMSGGITNVRAEDIKAIHSESGVRIKTARGRGGHVTNIWSRRLELHTMKYVFWMTGAYGDHATKNYDPHALPLIQAINFRDVAAENVTMAAQLDGLPDDRFTGICISNVTIYSAVNHKKVQWNCSDIEGVSSNVNHVPPLMPPKPPCRLLPNKDLAAGCDYPTEPLAIDQVKPQTCAAAVPRN